MKTNTFNLNTIHSARFDLNKDYSKLKLLLTQSLMIASLFVILVFSTGNVKADQLWNNGDTDGSILGWGQYSSTLDDFYVPGGGWYVNHVETRGIFVDPSTVDEVEVAIWAHDYQENEPNGSDVIFSQVLNDNNFEVTSTGRTFLDREEIKISIDFDNTYLKGQEYYWIEITVRDPYGVQDFRFLARQNISHEPSWTHFGQGSLSPSNDVYGKDLDLSFALHGTPVKFIFNSPVDDLQVEGNDDPVVFDVNKIIAPDGQDLNSMELINSNSHPQINDLGFAIRCPRGSTRTPFEMPIYDKATGLWVVGYETVWFCISDDNKPAG
jgi:hypothetical protein